jgi:hypothetical protein
MGARVAPLRRARGALAFAAGTGGARTWRDLPADCAWAPKLPAASGRKWRYGMALCARHRPMPASVSSARPASARPSRPLRSPTWRQPRAARGLRPRAGAPWFRSRNRRKRSHLPRPARTASGHRWVAARSCRPHAFRACALRRASWLAWAPHARGGPDPPAPNARLLVRRPQPCSQRMIEAAPASVSPAGGSRKTGTSVERRALVGV